MSLPQKLIKQYFGHIVNASLWSTIDKIGDWGEISTQLTPNREIGLGFLSCSCRACQRAGEAKLCVCVCARKQYFPTRVPRPVRCVGAAALAAAWSFSFLLLCSCVFLLWSWLCWSFLPLIVRSWFLYVCAHLVCFCCYVHVLFYYCFLVDRMLMGLSMLLHTLFAFVAMSWVFIFSYCWWYIHSLLDVFAHLVRFRWYVHVVSFFLSCFPQDVDGMLIGVLFFFLFWGHAHVLQVCAHLVRVCCYVNVFVLLDFLVFYCMLIVFWCFCTPLLLSLLRSWVCWGFFVFVAMLMGFLMLWHSWSHLTISTADHNRQPQPKSLTADHNK